jgi:hypothetical protein
LRRAVGIAQLDRREARGEMHGGLDSA